jgi:hypothetical protein
MWRVVVCKTTTTSLARKCVNQQKTQLFALLLVKVSLHLLFPSTKYLDYLNLDLLSSFIPVMLNRLQVRLRGRYLIWIILFVQRSQNTKT